VSFLYPWLWLGALGAAVPLWLHLRAKTGVVVPFTAVQFLEDQPRPRLVGVRLRDLPLFLLRLAALLLVVAGFAWPYLEGIGAAVTESRVHVLDNTLSRQVEDGFQRDRERVRAALAGSGPEVQQAVVELSARPRVVVAFGDDRGEADRKVAELTPSFQRGSYLEAFRLAQSVLSRGLGTRRRILVHGDHQENQWTEGENSPPFLEAVDVDLGERPRVLERANVAVSDPAARRFFLGEKTYVDFQARLAHGRLDGPATVEMVLEAEGRTVTRERVTLRPEPETLTLRGQWPTDPSTWLRGELHLEGLPDALPADDRIYFCLPPVREGRLALLTRSPYLRAALAPEIARGRWTVERLDPAAPLAQVSEKDLKDVLLLDGDYAQSRQVRDLAFRYLNNERGVVLMLGRTTPLLAGFLGELGFDPGGAVDAPEGRGQAFRFVAAQHPIFKPFVTGELGDLLEVRVQRHVRLKARQASPLLYGESGDPLFLEGGATRGRLLVFAFALERSHTDWPLQPSFIPFLDLTLQHARAAAPLETSALPGDLYVHEVPRDQGAREVVLRGGGRELRRAALDDQRRVRLPVPDRPGFYELTYDDDPAVRALVAVNPSSKESELRFTPEPGAVTAWSLPPRTDPAPAAASAAFPETAARALGQRLWWWLLLAAAAALAMEGGFLWRRREGT
jgi:hypothetical protein